MATEMQAPTAQRCKDLPFSGLEADMYVFIANSPAGSVTQLQWNVLTVDTFGTQLSPLHSSVLNLDVVLYTPQ